MGAALGLGPQGPESLLCSQALWGVPSPQALAWGRPREHFPSRAVHAYPGGSVVQTPLSAGLSTSGAVSSWGAKE